MKGWHVSELQILSAYARRSSFRTSNPWLPSANPISKQDHFWRFFLQCGDLKLDWYQPLNSDEQMVMTLSHFRPGQTPARDLFSSLGGFPKHRSVSRADALPAMEVKRDTPLLLYACTATAAGVTLLSQSQHCSHGANTALTIPTLLSQFQPELVCCNSFTVDTIYTPHVLVILSLHEGICPPSISKIPRNLPVFSWLLFVSAQKHLTFCTN